jgi:hypothetical protein
MWCYVGIILFVYQHFFYLKSSIFWEAIHPVHIILCEYVMETSHLLSERQ